MDTTLGTSIIASIGYNLSYVIPEIIYVKLCRCNSYQRINVFFLLKFYPCVLDHHIQLQGSCSIYFTRAIRLVEYFVIMKKLAISLIVMWAGGLISSLCISSIKTLVINNNENNFPLDYVDSFDKMRNFLYKYLLCTSYCSLYVHLVL